MHMACRGFFATRWFLENFMMLVQAKVLRDTTKGGFWAPFPVLNKYAKRAWFLALCCGVTTEVLKLRRWAQKKELLFPACKDIKCVGSCGPLHRTLCK